MCPHCRQLFACSANVKDNIAGNLANHLEACEAVRDSVTSSAFAIRDSHLVRTVSDSDYRGPEVTRKRVEAWGEHLSKLRAVKAEVFRNADDSRSRKQLGAAFLKDEAIGFVDSQGGRGVPEPRGSMGRAVHKEFSRASAELYPKLNSHKNAPAAMYRDGCLALVVAAIHCVAGRGVLEKFIRFPSDEKSILNKKKQAN